LSWVVEIFLGKKISRAPRVELPKGPLTREERRAFLHDGLKVAGLSHKKNGVNGGTGSENRHPQSKNGAFHGRN